MASGQLSRAEALACSGCRHACHVMLYADTKAQLFGRIPIKHVILMQMRFDGLLGFPGGCRINPSVIRLVPKYLGSYFSLARSEHSTLFQFRTMVPDLEVLILICRLVNPSEETLESGLSRELSEEVGLTLPISVQDHVDSCFAPASSSSSSSSRLITHFYVKKMDEEQIREVERAAASTATDHGQEVLGMIRVPVYTTKGGGGLASFLSHSFIGSARSQLVDAMLRFNLVAPGELHKALKLSLKTNVHTKQDLQAALALMEEWRK